MKEQKNEMYVVKITPPESYVDTAQYMQMHHELKDNIIVFDSFESDCDNNSNEMLMKNILEYIKQERLKALDIAHLIDEGKFPDYFSKADISHADAQYMIEHCSDATILIVLMNRLTLGDELVGANNGLVSGEGALAHDVCINDLNSFLFNAVYIGKHLGVLKDMRVRQIVGIHIKTKGDDDNV